MVEIGQQGKTRRNEAPEVVVRKVKKLNSGGIEEAGRKGATDLVAGKRENGQ
jgi:hypothetical protein